MKHLWQRIFAYTLVLIVISQTAVLLLHLYSIRGDETRRFITESVSSIASSIDGQKLENARSIARLFNIRGNRVWVENASGNVIAGARPSDPGMFDKDRAPGHWKDGSLDIWETAMGSGYFLASLPVTLDGSPAILNMTFRPPRYTGIWNMFFQGLIALSCVGVMLALWMAWRVSRPLRTLRGEVMTIAAGNLDRRVTVAGADEIADVATAVNHMASTLARNIRGMRELVANISHELRSPLARMQISLAILEENMPLPCKQNAAKNSLSRLHEELDHMNKLIGVTLLTSKLDLQQQKTVTTPVAFAEICAAMCRRQEPVFEEQGFTFTTDIEPDMTFPGDETLLSQMVSNLLDNAAKYTVSGGSVRLTLCRDGSTAVLAVENTHAPLAPDVLEHIFEPFYRGGIATGNGVGLGLSLVSKIAALHHGTTAVENTEAGVRFTVRIALVE